MPENFPVIKSNYSVIRTPVFKTHIVTYGNNVEQRNACLDEPYHKITFLFNTKSLDDADLIYAFFIARKGSYESFYLQNHEEAYRNKTWKASTSYAAGDIVRPVTANGRSYKCTTAGISYTSEPSWPTTYHGTVTDNSVTWRENSYRVRFEEDMINLEAFFFTLYTLGRITFIEVPE